MTDTPKKNLLRSKTVWFNVIVILGAAASELLPIVDVVPPEAQRYVHAGLMALVAAGNMTIRFYTKEGIAWRS